MKRALAVLFVLLAHAPARGASTQDEFNRARNAFTFGNYPEAVALLRGLLNPMRLREEDRIAEARQLLGVSLYFVKQFDAAREEFERLLFLRPRQQLDPLLFPPPVIEFFEKVRETIKDKLARLHPELRPSQPGPVIIERRVERNHYLLSFFPFGVGQFQNRQNGKAAFFLSAELAMLATNLVTYGAVESLRRADGRFDARDEGLAKNLRIVQIVSLSAFGALVVWGIVDALVEYRPEVVTERKRGGAPASPAKPPASPKAGRRLQYFPWVASGGGGLGVGFRF